MTIDVLIPPYLQPQGEFSTLVDDGSVVFRPTLGAGAAQRNSVMEPHLRIKQSYKNLSGAERGALVSVLRRAQGKFGTIRGIVGYNRRGSFPASELLTNNTFANSTSGWSAYNSTINTNDRILRAQPTGVNTYFGVKQTGISITRYAPYALRVARAWQSMASQSFSAKLDASAYGGTYNEAAVSGGTGLALATYVPTSNQVDVYGYFPASAGSNTVFDQINFSYLSLTRCALVDNGTNLLLRSDEFDNAAWTKSNCTVSADAVVAPDGTTTGDSMTESITGSGVPSFSQSATVSATANLDYTITVAAKMQARRYLVLIMTESSLSSPVKRTFDLQSGALGAATTTGVSWSNVRTFITSLGNGWYQCTMVATKISTATTVTFTLQPDDVDSPNNYTMLSGAIPSHYWRATAAQSSVPVRLAQTTSAATAGSAQTGSALYVKGLPASTNGLLLPDDLIEIGGELKQVTGGLNSDASGLGYFQFAPALFRSPSDNDPVIVQQPMGKFILGGDASWQNNLGVYADIDIELNHIYE
jgi:hypothetical protein